MLVTNVRIHWQRNWFVIVKCVAFV